MWIHWNPREHDFRKKKQFNYIPKHNTSLERDARVENDLLLLFL